MPTGTGERAFRVVVLAAALLAAAGAGAAEVSLQVELDRSEAAQDEVVTLQAILESSEAPSVFELARSPDFEVMGQVRSQESSFTLGGGGGARMRQLHRTTWQLRPTRTGSLAVPRVKAVVSGREHLGEALVLKVSAPGTGAPAQPGGPGLDRPGGSPSYRGWEKDLRLEAEIDKREVFVGEQLTVAFWLLTRQDLLGAETAAPRYDGFWKEELEKPTPIRFERRTVNGIPMRAYLIQRVALFPIRSGELTIDPMVLPVIQLGLGSQGIFGPDHVVRASRRSEPLRVRVKPLPPGAPAGFEPANVGALKVEGTATPARVSVGEPVTVRLSVSGDGNVRAFSPPRLQPIRGTRTFQPTTQDRVETRDRRLLGTRTLETVLVPAQTGELVIPPVDWPYFDPAAGQYRIARTPELTVTVLPAGVPAQAAPGSNTLSAGLRPIRSAAKLSRRGPPAWEQPWFLALLLAPPAAFFSIWGLERLRTRGAAPSLRGASRSARRQLAVGRRRLARGDPAGATAEAERALLGYASGRLGGPASGLTREALSAELTAVGAHPPAVKALLRALDLADASRFGAAGARAEEVLDAAERAIDLLEEADWQPATEDAA